MGNAVKPEEVRVVEPGPHALDALVFLVRRAGRLSQLAQVLDEALLRLVPAHRPAPKLTADTDTDSDNKTKHERRVHSVTCGQVSQRLNTARDHTRTLYSNTRSLCTV